MKISCDIIGDLLPLYAEELVSEDSKKMVEEHLCACEPCTRQLGVLKKAAKVPIEVETTAIKRVESTIRRKRILAVLTALGLLGTLIFGAAMLMDARIYLPADRAVEEVRMGEDGTFYVYWSDLVTERGSMGEVGYTASGNYGVIAFTRLHRLLSGGEKKVPYAELSQEMKSLIDPEYYGASSYQLVGGADSYNIWYVDVKDGTGETLLWDADNPYDGSPLDTVNDHIGWYVAVLAQLCILLLVISEVAMKARLKSWQRELCFRFAAVFGSLSLSTVIVTAGQFMELWGEFTEAVTEGAALAVPMALTVIAARELRRISQLEKKPV